MLNTKQRETLHQIARRSIAEGLDSHQPLAVDLEEFDETLREKAATFVTLNKNGDLRGCIGILEPLRPLVEDVAYNAFQAAFRDPRFPPLERDELAALSIHISVLNPPEEMQFHSENELIEQLRPGEDGLIIEDGYARATFLPSVWESLSDRKDFLRHLKLKAGLGINHWSDTFTAKRYSVESF